MDFGAPFELDHPVKIVPRLRSSSSITSACVVWELASLLLLFVVMVLIDYNLCCAATSTYVLFIYQKKRVMRAEFYGLFST